jgi:hypothetical protein
MSLFAPFSRAVQSSRSWSGRLSDTTGTLVTASGSIHTLGTNTELIASTAHDSHTIRIIVHATAAGNTQTDQLLNIYVGSGDGQVLIPNLLTGWTTTFATSSTPGPRVYEFPLRIPQGSRLSAKLQALIASDTVRVMVELEGGGSPPRWVGQGVECIGASAAASQGTSVTPGGASEGTFTDIGTTAREWHYLQPMAQGGLTDTVLATVAWAADIGVGGVAISGLEEFIFHSEAGESTRNTSRGRYCTIPAGTALQLRSQTSGTVDTHDWCIYGVY